MNEDRNPSPLEEAIAFLEEQDETYTDEALYDALLEAGYPRDVASEALRQRQRSEPPATAATAADAGPKDLRGRAALALVGGAVLAWLACAAILAVLLPNDEGVSGIALFILAAVLALVLLIAVVVALASRSLRTGAQGALTAILVVPFVFFFGLAGTCVVIMSGF